jgi:hypothetical protein
VSKTPIRRTGSATATRTPTRTPLATKAGVKPRSGGVTTLSCTNDTVVLTPSPTDHLGNAAQLVEALDEANYGENEFGEICYPYNIFLQGGTYDLSGETVYLPNGIYRPVILHGADASSNRATLKVSTSHLLDIKADADVELHYVTVTNNGEHDGRFSGGAIANAGTLSIFDSVINNNAAEHEAGAILNWGTLNLTRTIVSNNTASAGGAIRNEGGTLIATCASFLNNTADWHGAILQVQNTTMTITKSKFVGNHASSGEGGAIGAWPGTTVNATNNWWGASGGIPVNTSGAGTDTVYGNVIVEPVAEEDPITELAECEAQAPALTPTPSPTPSPSPTPQVHCGDLPPAGGTIDERAACYGITFTVDRSAGGDATIAWNDSRKQAVLDSAYAVTSELADLLGLGYEPATFELLFGEQEFRLVGNSSGQAQCSAIVDTPQVVKFNVGGMISAANANCVNQYTATHELGHALRSRIISGGGDDTSDYLLANPLQYQYTDQQGNPQTVTIMGIFGGIWTRGQYGWGCGTQWQQHPETPTMLQDVRLDEGFADLFLNWIYGQFRDTQCPGGPWPSPVPPNFTPGTLRNNYMTDMLEQLAPYAAN